MRRPHTFALCLLGLIPLVSCGDPLPQRSAALAGIRPDADPSLPLLILHAHKVAVAFPSDAALTKRNLTKDQWYTETIGAVLRKKWASEQGLADGVFHLHLPVLVVNLSPFEKAVGGLAYAKTLKAANASAFAGVRALVLETASGKDPLHPEGFPPELTTAVLAFIDRTEAAGLQLLTLKEQVPEPLYSRITEGEWEEMGPVTRIRSDGVPEKDDVVPLTQRSGSLRH